MIYGRRRFVAFWYRVSWAHFSLGFHVDVSSPNIEIHVPFGFVRVGWARTRRSELSDRGRYRRWGYEQPDTDDWAALWRQDIPTESRNKRGREHHAARLGGID